MQSKGLYMRQRLRSQCQQGFALNSMIPLIYWSTSVRAIRMGIWLHNSRKHRNSHTSMAACLERQCAITPGCRKDRTRSITSGFLRVANDLEIAAAGAICLPQSATTMESLFPLEFAQPEGVDCAGQSGAAVSSEYGSISPDSEASSASSLPLKLAASHSRQRCTSTHPMSLSVAGRHRSSPHGIGTRDVGVSCEHFWQTSLWISLPRATAYNVVLTRLSVHAFGKKPLSEMHRRDFRCTRNGCRMRSDRGIEKSQPHHIFEPSHKIAHHNS